MLSIEFFAILIISLLLYWLLPKQKYRNLFLCGSSLLFIWLLDHQSLVVVLVLSIISYLFAQLIYRNPKVRWIHAVGVIVVLLALLFFKYLGFLGGVFTALYMFLESLPHFKIHYMLLPLGISYITFKHISYLTDVKWRLVGPGNFVDFLLYSSLFTIFLAGPIERFERLEPQLNNPRIAFRRDFLSIGTRRIVTGLFKKLVIADWIGFFISFVWSNPTQYHPAIALAAVFAYAFQIYYDFAGYSDIAIGASQLFGLHIMENFNKPYLAKNISDFWRRWHISLSDWIRDYLFFPLSALGKSKLWRIFFVPVMAMGICGLWHGAEARYLVWGVWHGLGLSVYQGYQLLRHKLDQTKKEKLDAIMAKISWPLTYLFVVLTWLSFRSFGLPLAKHIFLRAEAVLYLPLLFLLLMLFSQVWGKLHFIKHFKLPWRPAYNLYLLLLIGICHCAMNMDFIYAAF